MHEIIPVGLLDTTPEALEGDGVTLSDLGQAITNCSLVPNTTKPVWTKNGLVSNGQSWGLAIIVSFRPIMAFTQITSVTFAVEAVCNELPDTWLVSTSS